MSRFRASEAADLLACEVTQRLRDAGFRTWRFTPDGRVEGPESEGPNVEFIRESARRWLSNPVTGPSKFGDGWLLVHVIRDRRAEAGLVACELESGNKEQAETAWKLVGALVSEGRDRVRDSLAVDAFTEQLGEAYEYTSLLYRIGRSLGDIGHTEKTIRMAVEELTETASFGWGGAVFMPNQMPWITDRTLMVGPNASPEARLAIERVAAAHMFDSNASIVNSTVLEAMEARELLGRQVLAQPIRVREQTAMVLLMGQKLGEDPEASSYDTQLIEAVASSLATLLDSDRFYHEQEDLYLGVITSMTSALDAKDRYTRGHSERVATLARTLATAVGVDDLTAERIYVSGLLHDIGKIGVPEAVLLKTSRLTDEEFEEIKRHPVIGHDILQTLPGMQDVLPGVLHHHERWDGRGYPHGLAGEDIPLMARFLGLADTFDAMSSTRAYRDPLARTKVLEEIIRCAGSQFDPDLAHEFVKMDFAEFDRLIEQHRADSVEQQSRKAA